MAELEKSSSQENSIRENEIMKPAADEAHLAGLSPEKQAIYRDFSSKDEEWRAYQNKKLLRKVDIRLLPLLIVMYLLNFLDRSNLAQARLGTLEKDLGMGGTDFNLATSILFVVRRDVPISAEEDAY
jgi:hypothetical protein